MADEGLTREQREAREVVKADQEREGATAALCWAQGPMMVRCDRRAEHFGKHSWEMAAAWQAAEAAADVLRQQNEATRAERDGALDTIATLQMELGKLKTDLDFTVADRDRRHEGYQQMALLAKERGQAVARLGRRLGQVRKRLADEHRNRKGLVDAKHDADLKAAGWQQVAKDRQDDYEGACKTIAEMHAAAMGRPVEKDRPEEGIIDDVRAMRRRLDRAFEVEGLLRQRIRDAETTVARYVMRLQNVRKALVDATDAEVGRLAPANLLGALAQTTLYQVDRAFRDHVDRLYAAVVGDKPLPADSGMELSRQIDGLANVLMEEFGGPQNGESACEMAVRLLRQLPADKR